MFREKIIQVYEADLKNESGFVFQLELDEDIEDNGSTGSLQLKCQTESEMTKWIENITKILSVSVGFFNLIRVKFLSECRM